MRIGLWINLVTSPYIDTFEFQCVCGWWGKPEFDAYSRLVFKNWMLNNGGPRTWSLLKMAFLPSIVKWKCFQSIVRRPLFMFFCFFGFFGGVGILAGLVGVPLGKSFVRNVTREKEVTFFSGVSISTLARRFSVLWWTRTYHKWTFRRRSLS